MLYKTICIGDIITNLANEALSPTEGCLRLSLRLIWLRNRDRVSRVQVAVVLAATLTEESSVGMQSLSSCKRNIIQATHIQTHKITTKQIG